MTDHRKQMELGKLTKATRYCKKWQIKCEEFSKDNQYFKEDAMIFADLVDILMDYGLDKYGPEFDEAVKDWTSPFLFA